MIATPFTPDPELTGIVTGYRNTAFALIADGVMPRLDPMMKSLYNYHAWQIEEAYSPPEARVGRKSYPREVEFNAARLQGEMVDYALDDFLPQGDLDEAGDTLDPRGRAAEGITDLLHLAREIRVAGIAQNAANYDNTVTLSGTDQWSDFAASAPILDLTTAIDAPLVRPNTMALGRIAWSILAQHPDILKAINRTSGDKGVARKEDVAELLELNEILVGEARLNASKKGQTPVYSRVWGKSVSLLHLNPLVRNPTANQITWGWTAQKRGASGEVLEAGGIPDPKRGARGGETIRALETIEERVVSTQAGYLIVDAVA